MASDLFVRLARSSVGFAFCSCRINFLNWKQQVFLHFKIFNSFRIQFHNFLTGFSRDFTNLNIEHNFFRINSVREVKVYNLKTSIVIFLSKRQLRSSKDSRNTFVSVFVSSFQQKPLRNMFSTLLFIFGNEKSKNCYFNFISRSEIFRVNLHQEETNLSSLLSRQDFFLFRN